MFVFAYEMRLFSTEPPLVRYICANCAADRALSASNDPAGVVNIKQRRKLNKK